MVFYACSDNICSLKEKSECMRSPWTPSYIWYMRALWENAAIVNITRTVTWLDAFQAALLVPSRMFYVLPISQVF